jgi:penicillin-binding protein 1A
MAQLPALIGEMRSDVIVSTTIDLGLQRQAGDIIAGTLAKKGEKLAASQGALVALDTSGGIKALVGGRDYSQSQFNRAVDAKRQPGSAFKPVVYLTALETGLTPDSLRNDARIRIGNWTPENYDKKYRGPVTLETGLSRSLNTIAAQLVLETGPKPVIETARRLGIQSEIQPNASIALGTSEVSMLELAAAYAPFANGGFQVKPWLVRRITTAQGDILYERKAEEMPVVVSPRELGMMNAMLKSAVQSGTGSAAQVEGHEIAGKTGTTQNSRDAWFIGYSASIVTAVWYGNDDGAPMKKVTGGGIPSETFATFMTKAHEGLPSAALPGFYERPALTPGEQIAGNELPQFMEGREEGVIPDQSLPRPQTEVGAGGERRKPRNIFELLFGKAG